MYDKYPEHDVPQNNIVQRFFGQRWSAIVIEILMTIVITVAAGRAFDFFGPLEPSADTTAIELLAELPPEIAEPGQGISIDAVRHMAKSYLDNGDFAEAKALLDLLIAAEPDNVSYYPDRAKAASAMGDYNLAYRDTYTALRLEPVGRQWYLNNNLCYFAGELGEYELALAHCDAVLEGAADASLKLSALENRCWVRVEMGDYGSGIDDCLAVLQEDPDCQFVTCVLAHYNLGRIRIAQGKIAVAVSHFDIASSRGPSFEYQYANMYLELARVYDRLGRSGKALENYQQYLQIVGRNADPVAQSRLSALRGAD